MPQQIELKNIVLHAEKPLVNGVSLSIKRGRVLALVGGSGSGKSLTCAAALGIVPSGVHQMSGTVLADGNPVSLVICAALKSRQLCRTHAARLIRFEPWPHMRGKPAWCLVNLQMKKR